MLTISTLAAQSLNSHLRANAIKNLNVAPLNSHMTPLLTQICLLLENEIVHKIIMLNL